VDDDAEINSTRIYGCCTCNALTGAQEGGSGLRAKDYYTRDLQLLERDNTERAKSRKTEPALPLHVVAKVGELYLYAESRALFIAARRDEKLRDKARKALPRTPIRDRNDLDRR